MDNTYNKNYEILLPLGEEGESEVGKLLINLGYSITPLYSFNPTKAPKIITQDDKEDLTLPDMLASKDYKSIWIESKVKSEWLSRLTSEHCTGIDIYLYNHYKKVQELTGIKVYIAFTQTCCDNIGEYGTWILDINKNPFKELTMKGNRKMIVWKKSQMKKIKDSEETAKALKEKINLIEKAQEKELEKYFI
jgi:hypothetical protein